MRRGLNPGLRVLGVLPTKYKQRHVHDNLVLDGVHAGMAGLGVRVFEPVLLSAAFSKASLEGKPTVVLSPDEMNRYLRTVTIAALTSTRRDYPSRVDCTFQGKEGQVALDHIRSVDKSRLVRRLGVLPKATAQEVCDRLQEIFQY